MTTTATTVDSLARSFRRMLVAAGDEAPALRRSLWLFAAAAVVEGLALGCLFPLFHALLATPADGAAAARWLVLMGALVALEGALRWWANGSFTYSHHYAQVGHQLRLRLGEQLRRMPLEKLYQRRTGELTATLAGNVDELTTPMGMVSALLLRALIAPSVALLVVAYWDWRLALLLAALLPAAAWLYRRRRRALAKSMRRLAAAHADTSAEIVEYVQGLPVLRATNRTGARAERLQTALTRLEEVQRQDQKAGRLPGLLFASLVEVGLWLAVALGAWLVASGTLELATLAAVLVIAARFAEPLSLFIGVASVFDYMEAGLRRVEALFAIKPLPVAPAGAAPKGLDIAFEQVSFSYEGSDERALKDLNFIVPERSMIAFVGPSGSGKTTAVRLIMRYADPHEGCIRLGGCDLRALEPERLMGLVSAVFQDVYLFNDSILNNIRMGRPDATDAEVEEAARRAHCHGFISRLPQGYCTQVGDIGGRLSGGEKQRISIARALLKNAPIVILDEPTAALDTESEVAVQQAVDELVRDRTVVVIAHRLSTVVGADRILVFDEGGSSSRGGMTNSWPSRGCTGACGRPSKP
ncbi:ABC transporter ATP-binding protein [Alkalilimnicola ehrlichii]|uniref:ABC transporter ATP-binding protein n=1 Tax=Alkalilimnicola ehrlichii TaxID=351052 RepID=UPI001C6E7B65|nr:ABC transporter ATP-binding protein [Alkalilimnicola ehrlichii]